ncbi:hypothetical protein LTR86_003227 [Recurvomyces mirabilis]|nr:hypothetical protein LTR86_003227 [Recurvomyces mirabilis]
MPNWSKKTWSVEVPVDHIDPPVPGRGYEKCNPRQEILPAGWNGFKSKALTSDILVDHDVSWQVRDGATLYADVYRPPPTDEKVPALICWSPFAKKFNGITSLQVMTYANLGIPNGTLSGLEKFEGPDPADWCPRGYAIINVDVRGTGDSEGIMAVLGSQEGEDGYDTVEFFAKQPWCNASQRPPSLTAIAPWEGCGDLYREQFARGGIWAGDMYERIIKKYMLRGHHGTEGMKAMFDKHPLANDWWNDKRPDMKKINVPTYITGTWSNTMHGMGAIRGWLEVDTPEKWLRWHPWQEWYDLWGNKEAAPELMQFFDHYLKGANNGWEKTPKVRMGVLKFGKSKPLENVVEEGFPIPRTQYRKAYLQPGNKLSLESTPSSPQTIEYDSTESESYASFTHTFDKTTQIVGMSKAILYMSCDDLDDMDIFIMLRKLDKDGQPMLALNVPWEGLPVTEFDQIPREDATEVILYAGPTGILRASLRAIDWDKTMHENWPFYPQDKEEKIEPGKVVRLEIGIWATGIEFEAGESIRFQVAGTPQGLLNFPMTDHVKNKGVHKIHVGGQYDSHVVLPFT